MTSTRLFPAAALFLAALTACESQPRPAARLDPGPVPPRLVEGERRYNGSCAPCHGALGAGTDAGPPLVHRIYEPGHHSDAAFQLAVVRGVRAHHWSFGNMPPVPGLDSAAVAEVTAYVRWLQEQAGIR